MDGLRRDGTSMPDLEALGELTARFNLELAQNRLSIYEPYWWQVEFHKQGKDNEERMLMAANRVGKTMDAGAEVAIHMTGDYPKSGQYFFRDTEVNRILERVGQDIWPSGWEGKRFDRPVLAWTGSPTNETSKDIVQKELLGGVGEDLGKGWIPRAKIVGKPTTRQAGVRNVVDTFQVRHISGGLSTCVMKTYEQGWQKWQGTAPHVVWMDEEPDDYMIFSESQTRILTSKGIVMVTFTPLSGVTELVEHFEEGGQGIHLMSATWDDAPHLSEKDKARLSKSYRAHERDARTKGIPMMGEGAIFPISDDRIIIEPFQIPDHFAIIKGCDFGYEHPAAGATLAIDRDEDIIYLVDSYKEDHQLPPYHAAWFNKTRKWAPVAWPHDGLNTEKSGGNKVKDAYASFGVNMMSKSARYPKSSGEKEKGGAQPQWPVIDEMRERMETNRFKVFSTQARWLEEKRSYHVKSTSEGAIKIVARRDDILKATFYAVMMKRYAVAPNSISYQKQTPLRPIASMSL